jgi:hypothetical protein
MSWTDEEIDKLFGDASEQQTFEYRSEYWKDIEKQLPVNRSKKPLFWWFAGNIFLVAFVSWIFVETVELRSEKSIDPKSNGNQQALMSSEQNSLVNANSQKTKAEASLAIENKIVSENVVEKRENESAYAWTKTSVTADKIDDEPINQLKEVEHDNEVADQLAEYEILPVISTSNDELINEQALKLSLIELSSFSSDIENRSILPSELKVKKLDRVGYFVELNGGVGQSWTRSNENEQGINGSVGLTAGISLPVSKFNLSAGLGFQATKFDDLKIKERTKIYGFGSSILENTYEFSSIYSLTLPLELSYSTGRHNVSVGVISSMNLFSRLQRTEAVNGTQTEYRSGVAKVDLFSRIGIQPTLGYSYSVNEKTKIGLRVGMNLVQPIQSDRFVGAPVKMPLNGQVYLMRTINF